LISAPICGPKRQTSIMVAALQFQSEAFERATAAVGQAAALRSCRAIQA
jgi:ribosomal protein L18E